MLEMRPRKRLCRAKSVNAKEVKPTTADMVLNHTATERLASDRCMCTAALVVIALSIKKCM